MQSLPNIYTVAIQAAIEASAAILRIYDTNFETIRKDDGSPVTQADLESSKIIHKHLQNTGIPIVGEEAEKASYSERSKWKESWCVDPLDGTRMFVQRNGEFSINIAHIVLQRSVFGIIVHPTKEKILFGGESTGVYTSTFKDFSDATKWKRLQPKIKVSNPVTVTCSRSYTHGSGFKYMQILENKFGELNYIRKGSALKFFDLAQGQADVYPRFAPTMEWDIAAGQAILEALGGAVVDVDSNAPLKYNKESLFNPRFIAKTKALLNE